MTAHYTNSGMYWYTKDDLKVIADEENMAFSVVLSRQAVMEYMEENE